MHLNTQCVDPGLTSALTQRINSVKETELAKRRSFETRQHPFSHRQYEHSRDSRTRMENAASSSIFSRLGDIRFLSLLIVSERILWCIVQ